jgi:uncharacterized protein (DUF2062 family)
MPEGVQIRSLTSNRLLYDSGEVAGSSARVTDRCRLANRIATWVLMVDQSVPVKTDIRNCFNRLKRTARYRLVTPLQRSRHPPGYVARGVAIGLFWAMTPTIGIQMPMVLLHWLMVRKVDRWDFNLIHAWAWTWVTNFATMFPVYYTFYITGQLIFGNWDDLTGYRGFLELWDTSAGATTTRASPDGMLEQVWYSIAGLFDWASNYFVIVVKHWGLPMLIGCVPYAIFSAWIGYVWSMRIVISHRRSILERRLHRHDRRLVDNPHGQR